MPKRRPDHYSQKAQSEGLAARSAYKLEELDKRWVIFERGARVLDLGCSPGSWCQYAARRVGDRGQVVGYDLKPVNAAMPPNVVTEVRDVFDLLDDVEAQGSYDVVMSDMAPSTTGQHQTDALRSEALVEAALAIADHCLKPGGHVVTKILEGGGTQKIFEGIRQGYSKAQRLRPKATRRRSTEIFLVGLGRKAT